MIELFRIALNSVALIFSFGNKFLKRVSTIYILIMNQFNYSVKLFSNFFIAIRNLVNTWNLKISDEGQNRDRVLRIQKKEIIEGLSKQK